MAAKAVVKVPEANSRSKMMVKVIKVVANIFFSFSFLDNWFFLELIDYLWAAGKVLNRWS